MANEEKKIIAKIKRYEKSLTIDENDIDAYDNLGNAFLELIEFRENKEEKEHVLKKAIKNLQKAVELDENEANYFNNLGTALLELSKLKKNIKEKEYFLTQAIDNFTKAVKLDDKFAFAYNNLGLSLSDLALIKDEKAELIKNAFENIKKAIELDEDDEDYKESLKEISEKHLVVN